jgi:hypothetical protein
MKPDRYETSPAGRRQLSGLIEKRGSQMGMASWIGFIVGGAFVAVGVYVLLVGTKTLSVDPGSLHAPYWVLTVTGALFALGGLMIWGMAWTQLAANRQRLQAARRYPDEPALADYRWHPDGFEVSEWTGAAKAFTRALGLTVFLSIFNWWAFWGAGPWMVKTIVILFDCVGLALWWQAARQLGRAFKFGHSRMVFTRFPLRLSEPVIVRWQPSKGVTHVNKGAFTLRCVEERMETSRIGSSRRTYLVHEEIWSARWVLDQPRKLQVKEAVELRYDLPADARPTQLRSACPVYWEIEVKLDLPGLGFQESYLVPIYGPGTTAPVAGPAPVITGQQGS